MGPLYLASVEMARNWLHSGGRWKLLLSIYRLYHRHARMVVSQAFNGSRYVPLIFATESCHFDTSGGPSYSMPPLVLVAMYMASG